VGGGEEGGRAHLERGMAPERYSIKPICFPTGATAYNGICGTPCCVNPACFQKLKKKLEKEG
jgi:hypothetical protein